MASPSRAALVITYGAANMEAWVRVYSDYLQLFMSGGDGPELDLIIPFEGWHDVYGQMNLGQLVQVIQAEGMAASASLAANAAEYCLATWLEVTGQLSLLGGSVTLNMAAVWAVKNPTQPAAGSVRAGVQFGDGGNEFTGTLVVPRRLAGF